MDWASSEEDEPSGTGNNTSGASTSHVQAVRSQADNAVPVGSKRKSDARAQKHKRQPTCTIPARPPETPELAAGQQAPMVASQSTADVPENYTDDEKALNSFQKLHPLLSLESTSQRALQLVANLLDTTELPTREVPCITKTYDDQFLRPANASIGERPCCLGNKCIGLWIAIFRYGDQNDKGFVCREFLLPKQHEEFEKTGKLPPQPAKCLLCHRYYVTYTYKLVRHARFEPRQVLS